jgi:hypothetical protein
MLAVLLMAAIPVPFLRGEEAVRLWQLVGGKHFRASFMSEAGGKVTLRRKDDGKTVTVTRDELMPADTIYLDDLAKTAKPSGGGTGPAAATGGGSDEALPAGEPGKNRLYPRTREEIRAGLREIQSRKKPDKVEGEVWAAVCRLNEHRFLAGVSSDVGTMPPMNEGAADASKACAAAGTISHGLGHSTDKCNLSMGHGNMSGTVDGYMNDGGDNNRERRGHRRWCLNPPMQNAGFGREGIFSAMWCMDSSGRGSRTPWAWPGRGLFPLEYFKGNAWSFYANGPIPSDAKVRIWKLLTRPTDPIPMATEPKGREIKVGYVFAYDNTINFEPDPSMLGKRGIYWVRIEGRGFREQYLTELY